MSFSQDVKSLSRAIETIGNQFGENSSDLLVLDSRDIVDKAVADTVRQIEKLGLGRYETYVNERLVSQVIPISDHVKRNELYLFRRPPITEKSTTGCSCCHRRMTARSSSLDCKLQPRQAIVT